MTNLIYSIATAALLAAVATIGFTPASAMITTPDLKLYVGSSVTPVHCQKKYHCHWRGEGANRNKHCHICGYQLAKKVLRRPSATIHIEPCEEGRGPLS